MRRIERMEKKHKKNPLDKKQKSEKEDDKSSQSRPSEIEYLGSILPEESASKEDLKVKEDTPLNPDDEVFKDELPISSKKPIRKLISSASSGPNPPTTSLSREDRWMQWQLQRIAEMESSDTLPGDNLHHQSVNGSSGKQRRRGSSGAKISLVRCSQQKKEVRVDGASGEAECNLIVYKHREQDPMAKFSRSRTVHQHRQQNFLNRSYSLVESIVDEDLPAGGELLDDHNNGIESNGTSHLKDGGFSNSVPLSGSSSPPKPSKKRWLSQVCWNFVALYWIFLLLSLVLKYFYYIL